jgi:signal transduction histidine kinase/ligand-binding sensor domain-containing protein/CheY-like chemotaxis protein/HPt (histidine-containing phosphotransfer) domain-containing protein
MLRFSFFAALLASSAVLAPAQPAPPSAVPAEQYAFDLLGGDPAVPQTTVVLTGLQARDGYLWLGTEGGLVRFDGVKFASFRASNTPAFRSNLVRCLREDRQGNLWIGTEQGAVVRRPDGRFERIAGIPDAPVRALAEDEAGWIWLGTYGDGLHAISPDGAAHSHANDPAMASAFVTALFFDSANRLWVGFDKSEGLACRRDGRFTRWDDGGRRIDGSVDCITEAPQGTLWFGTRNHRLFRLQGQAMTRFRSVDGLPAAQMVDLEPARNGGLWVVGGGVSRVVDPVGFALAPVAHLPSALVNAVFEDREGTLWLCSRDVGLIRARKTPYRTWSTEDGLPADGVKTVSQDRQGNFWLAVLRRGVVRVTPEGVVSTFAREEGLTNSDPWSVLATRDGRIWAGFHDALSIREEGRWRQFPEIRGALGMYEDRQGDVWLGTENQGVIRYHEGRFQPVELGPGVVASRVGAFCETRDGAMYIGTWDSGLIKIQEGRVTVYNRQNGLPADDVRALHEDAEGRLWAGFRSRGLALWDGQTWHSPNALSEALADHVSAITEDRLGQLWIGTPGGVMRAPKKELAAAALDQGPIPALQTAGPSDALHPTSVWSGPQPVAWQAENGHLLFATRNGLLAIDPARLPRNLVAPPVLVEKVTIDGRTTPPNIPVVAPPGAREIAIDYTGLSFVQPTRVRFKYRLEGYDLDWIDAGPRRTAYYTNLSPGRYVFQVQAANSDGVWNTTGATLDFTQRPRFYQTWWFYAGLAAAGAAGVLGLHRWRTSVLRRENEKLNRLVAERTRELELSNSAKTEFLETVSHEIRNPLNGLNGLLPLLKRHGRDRGEHELADAVQACSRSLARIFEDILAHARLEHDRPALHETPFSLSALLADVARSFAWQANQQGVAITVALAPDLADGFVGDENKIKTILENFVGNALKYAPRSPVELRAEAHPGDQGCDVHLEVCDRGPGISPEEQALIFRKFVRGADAKKSRVPGTGLGLATCAALAETLGGHVGVESTSGEGSVFFLRVPLRRAADAGVAPTPGLRAGTALIVEDEHYNQVVLRGIALELGYTPHVAGNAEQAEALLANPAFDVVFLDWELPGLKGGDIARRIRVRPGGENPIIIAMTAHDSDDIRRRCREAGMDGFLRKPYDLAQVRSLLREALADRTRSVRPTDDEPAAEMPARPAGPDLHAFELYARGAADAGETGDAIQCFVDAVDREAAAIEAALPADEADKLAHAAHRLYAVAALVSGAELMQATKDLELLPPSAQAAERRRLAVRVLDAAATLRTAVSARRPPAAPPA